jgi:hypothetical protein
MKKHIIKALKWALSKFEDRTAEIAAWPFPVVTEDFDPRPKKPTVRKATTRTVKKPAVVAKTVAIKKTAKKKAK